MNGGDETVTRRVGVAWSPLHGRRTIERAAPTEVAVGVSFDGRPHTVLMATPDDVEDLAIGFTVTEAVASFHEILGVSLRTTNDGVLADVSLAPVTRARRARPRTLEGRSSCGLCGVQRLADAMRPLPVVAAQRRFDPQSVQRALALLEARQPLGRLTRATHAAAFAAPDGRIDLAREDVGRHNALDKLAGALLRAQVDPADGFVLVTSRCSFEMVEKTARLGCPMIVAISAPTDLAIRKAEAAGVTLVALAREDGHVAFSRTDRLAPALATA